MKMCSDLWQLLFVVFFTYSVNGQDYQDDTQFNIFPQPEIISKPIVAIVSEGESVTLPCEIKNKDPNAAVVWNINNSSVISVENDCFAPHDMCSNFQFNRENNSILLKNVSEEFVGYYYCLIRNAYIKHLVGIKATVEIGHTKKTVEVGEDLHLSCKVFGYPNPKIEWYRQKNADSPKESVGTAANVTIHKITEEKSGLYTCLASNSENQIPSSKTITINVVNGVAAEHKVVNAERVKSTLCCNFDIIQKTIWRKGEKEIQTNSQYEITNWKHKTCLTISNVSEENLGTYTCEVVKENGSTAKANIDLTGAPMIPKLESVIPDNNKNPVLKWKIISFSPITYYKIRAKKTEESDRDWKPLVENTNDTIKDSIQHTFTYLPNGSYDVELFIQSSYGSSKLVSISTVVIDNPDYKVISDKLAEFGNNGSHVAKVSILCIIFAVLTRLWSS